MDHSGIFIFEVFKDSFLLTPINPEEQRAKEIAKVLRIIKHQTSFITQDLHNGVLQS